MFNDDMYSNEYKAWHDEVYIHKCDCCGGTCKAYYNHNGNKIGTRCFKKGVTNGEGEGPFGELEDFKGNSLDKEWEKNTKSLLE